MNAVLDTKILVDYLQGQAAARQEVERYEHPRISLITWIEIMVGAGDATEEEVLRSFLSRFDLRPITPAVAERAVALRREHRMRLPDALIWATAQESGVLLVTRNSRDFPVDHPGVRLPYTL